MPLFIKNCFIYKLFDIVLIKPYNNSLLKKILQKVCLCFEQSFIFKRVTKYLDKKPYFLNSFIYKIFRKFIKQIDRLMNFLHLLIKKCLLGSNIFLELRNIKYDTKQKNLLLLSILIGSFNVAYTLVGAIINTVNLYVSSLLLVLALVLFLFSKNTNCFKQSFIYKIFKSW